MCLRPSWGVLEEIEMGVTDDVEDSLRRWVLQKIRQGVTVEQISLALAAQKVELMQADQYLTAIKDQERRP
jgi:hypothetical protein